MGRVVVRGSRFLLAGSRSWNPGGDALEKLAWLGVFDCCWNCAWLYCCCFVRFVAELLRETARAGELCVLVGAAVPERGV